MSTPAELLQSEIAKRGLLPERTDSATLIQDELKSRGLIERPGVVTSPLEAPEPELKVIRGGLPVTIPVAEVVVNAAEAGVMFDQPAPAGHYLASFAIDDEHRKRGYEIALGDRFGPQAEVRIGPKTGQLEWFSPRTNRFALVDPPGINVANIEGLAGPGIVIGSELVGGAAGAAIAANPAIAALGAGAGAFIGELIRLHIGRQLGVNDDVSIGEMATQAAKLGGISAGAGAAGAGLVKFGKSFLRFLDGSLPKADAQRILGLDAKAADDLTQRINARIEGETFRLNLAQATGDEDLLVIQDMLRRSPEYSAMFREFGEQQEAALRLYWDTINKPYRSRLTTTQTGERVQGVAEARVSRETMRQNEFVRVKEAELEYMLRGFDSRPYESLGRPIRDMGDAEQAAFRKWADDAARALNDVAGNDPFIANKAMFAAVRKFDREAREALIPLLERQSRSLIGQPAIVKETVGDDIIEVPARKIFDPEARFTFHEAWSTISALKRIERVTAKGLTTEGPEFGQVHALRTALESDLKAAMDGSPLAPLYADFIRRYAIQKRRLDTGAVGSIMERTGGLHGRYRIADEKVFESFFTPGTKREALEVYDLIKNDVRLLDETRRAIIDFWERTVVKDGRIDLNAHKRWLKRYRNTAAVFMNKHEVTMLTKPATVEKALRAREKARKTALDKLNKTFDAELVNLNNPARIAQMVMDRGNPGRASQVMDLLEGVPDVARAVRHEARKTIADRVAGQYKNGERFFSPARLDEFLSGKGGERGYRENLRNIFGDQYTEDLDMLNEAIKLVSREPQFPNRSNTAFWANTLKNLARAHVGMFTRPGRIITAIDRMRGRAANRVMARALLNPDALHTLVKLGDLREGRASAFIGAMGGAALLQDFAPGQE